SCRQQNSHAEVIHASVVAHDREAPDATRVQGGDEILRYPAQAKSSGSDRHVVVKQAVKRSLGVRIDFAHGKRLTTDHRNASERKVASEFSAKNGSTIIGTAHQAPPDWAAFATGCCIRYFDYNDTYLSKEPAHPSDNISAALAVAESVGATGREFITAIALAYEVQCRFCDAASLRARGWDHVTYGAFSTALASAKLMKLELEKTRHAVNIAGVGCAAMRQARVGELSHWKGVAFADAAR